MLDNSVIAFEFNKNGGNSLPQVKNSKWSVHIKLIIFTNVKIKT